MTTLTQLTPTLDFSPLEGAGLTLSNKLALKSIAITPKERNKQVAFKEKQNSKAQLNQLLNSAKKLDGHHKNPERQRLTPSKLDVTSTRLSINSAARRSSKQDSELFGLYSPHSVTTQPTETTMIHVSFFFLLMCSNRHFR